MEQRALFGRLSFALSFLKSPHHFGKKLVRWICHLVLLLLGPELTVAL